MARQQPVHRRNPAVDSASLPSLRAPPRKQPVHRNRPGIHHAKIEILKSFKQRTGWSDPGFLIEIRKNRILRQRWTLRGGIRNSVRHFPRSRSRKRQLPQGDRPDHLRHRPDHLPLRHRRLPDEKKKKRGRIRRSPEHRRRIGGGSNIQFRIQQKRRIKQQQ